MKRSQTAAQAVRENRNARVPDTQDVQRFDRKIFYLQKRYFNLTLTNTEYTIHLAKLVWEPQVFHLTFFIRLKGCAIILCTQTIPAYRIIPSEGGESTA